MSSPSETAGQKPCTPRGVSEPIPLDAVEERVRRLEELARRLALHRVVEDRRVAALELPDVEEERPVDVRSQLLERGLDEARAGEGRHREILGVPDDRRAPFPGSAQRQQRTALALRVERSETLLLTAVLDVERGPALRVEQRADDADHARRVEDVDGRRRVLGAIRTAVCCREVVAPPTSSGRSSPRRSISFATTTISSSDGRDQPREPDEVAILLDRGVEDRVRVDHHAEVDDLVVVAAEHDPDDVLADVVDVALDGRHHDAAGVPVGTALLGLHERLEVCDRPLHRTRALHDLREEHPARAEEVADDAHAVHQRPLDHLERPLPRLPRLLDVRLDEVDDPVHERVLEPLLHRCVAPGEILLAAERLTLVPAGELDQPLRRVRSPVPDHVLDALEELGLDVLVDHQHPRVDDRHVEARADRVVEERRVHRLADRLIAAEREREVRDAAARAGARAPLLDQRQRVDEGLRELVVLLDPGRDREDVRVEDQVLGREPGLLGQEPVRALADLDLPLGRLRLPLLVERHDDDRRAVASDHAGVLEEGLLPLLQRDRVDDALALQALEAGLDDRPPRAVDHDRQAGGLGLGGEQVEEARHRRLAVEQVGVHVHVERVCPAAHLLERHLDGGLEIPGLDERPEPGRAGDVRPLADHDEPRVRADLERLEPAPPRTRRVSREPARSDAVHRSGDLADVLGRRPATAADEVDETVLGERAEEAARVARLLVVLAHRVGEAGVRVAGHVRVGDPREPLEERPHVGRPERAVDADDQRARVLDGHPEGLRRLPGEIPAAAVDGREREPERQVGRDVGGRDDRRLRVQRVEDGLDEENVDTAFRERGDLLGVALADVVERDRAEARVVDLRRDRERDVERARPPPRRSGAGRASAPSTRRPPRARAARPARLMSAARCSIA